MKLFNNSVNEDEITPIDLINDEHNGLPLDYIDYPLIQNDSMPEEDMELEDFEEFESLIQLLAANQLIEYDDQDSDEEESDDDSIIFFDCPCDGMQWFEHSQQNFCPFAEQVPQEDPEEDLTQDGDIESNPGPTANEIMATHKILYRLETMLASVPASKLKAQMGVPDVFKKLVGMPSLTTDVIERFGRIAGKCESFIDDPSSNPVLATFFSQIVIPESVVNGVTAIGIILTIMLMFLVFTSKSIAALSSFAVLSLYWFRWDQVVIDKVMAIIQGKPLYEAQIFGEGLPHLDVLASMTGLFGQIAFTLLAFTGVSMIPHDRWYDNIIRRLDLIPKAATGAKTIWDTAGKAFEAARDECKVWFFSVKREELSSNLTPIAQVEKWASRVTHYLQLDARARVKLEQTSVDEVMYLFNQMHAWRSARTWNTMPKDCQNIIVNFLFQMNDLYQLVCASHALYGGPRTAPTTVLFSGKSGCGKSDLLTPFIASLFESRGYVGEEMEQQVYCRNIETDYWDGYCGQKAVYVDDAFQRRDTVAQPSPEYMEAIRMSNCAPYMVHMANLHEKGTFFSSEFVVYTTNMEDNPAQYIQSVICPEAVIRRLSQLSFRVLPRKEFATAKVVNYQTVHRLDPKKVRTCTKCTAMSVHHKSPIEWCKHCMMFEQYDLFTGDPIGKLLTFDEMVQVVVEFDKTHFHVQEDKTKFHRKLFSNPSLLKDPHTVAPVVNVLKAQVGEDEFDPMSFRAMMDAEDEDDGMYYPSLSSLDCEDEEDLMAFFVINEFHSYLQRVNTTEYDRAQYSLEMSKWMPFYNRYKLCGVKNTHNITDMQLATLLEKAIYEVKDFTSNGRLWHYRNNFIAALKRDAKAIEESIIAWYENLTVTKVAKLVMYLVGVCALVAGVCKIFSGDSEEPEVPSVELVSESAGSSAEPTVKLAPKIKTESAGSSGSPNVKTVPKIKTESAGSSGNPNTNSGPKIKTESSGSSGEPNTKLVSKIKTEMNIPLPRVSAQMDSDMAEVISAQGICDKNAYVILLKILRSSLYCLHSETAIYGNVLFVKGTTFLMPYHYVQMFKNNPELYPLGKKLSLSSHNGKSMVEVTIGHLIDNCIPLTKHNKQVDACLVSLNNVESKVCIHPNIIHLFITKDIITQLNGSYRAYLPSYSGLSQVSKGLFRDIVSAATNVKGTLDMEVESPLIDMKGKTYKVRQFWSYNAITQNGDCGAPLILFNNSLSNKIVGVHIAGGDDGGALGQVVTQEMLLDGMNLVPFRNQMCVEVQLHNIVGDEDQIESVPVHAGVRVYGVVSQEERVTSSGQTKITPSPLHNRLAPSLTAPSVLKPRGGVDPMVDGVMKYGRCPPLLNSKTIETVAVDVMNCLEINHKELERSRYARVLTYEEAVMGVDGEEFMAPINRSTSAGYPYVLEKNLKKGKQSFFGVDDWDLDTPNAKRVRRDVENLIEDCSNGIQRGVFWTDTMKDERRTLEKVRDCKTRLFCGGPQHLTIAFRRYFLGFAAWMMTNRNHNEIATGTNCFSYDWSIIAELLKSKGFDVETKRTNVIAGDFKFYDGSLNSQILWRICDLINDWYDDGEENARIRLGMWNHIVHSIHINGSVVYQLTHSQPSGCPITSILNSVYNSFIVRLAYLECAHNSGHHDLANMHAFRRYVALVSYGDDNLLAVAKVIKEWFNQVTLTEALSVLGHVYTDEGKTGQIVPFRDLSEVAFLKRTFQFDPDTFRYISPLNIDVVLEIAQWTKRGLQELDITKSNIDTTLRELSLHGPELFNEKCGIIRKLCREHNIDYQFQDYYFYRSETLNVPELYTSEAGDEVVVYGSEAFKKLHRRVRMAYSHTRIPKFRYNFNGKKYVIVRE